MTNFKLLVFGFLCLFSSFVYTGFFGLVFSFLIIGIGFSLDSIDVYGQKKFNKIPLIISIFLIVILFIIAILFLGFSGTA